MRIEDGKIKPCSSCYKTRQALKRAAGIVMQNKGKYTLCHMQDGDVTIANRSNTVYAVSRDDWKGFLERRVYLAGDRIIDVALARPIPAFGKLVKHVQVS